MYHILNLLCIYIMHSYERVNTQKRLAIGRHTNEMETDKVAAQDGLYVYILYHSLPATPPSFFRGSFEGTITELTSKFRTAVTFYVSSKCTLVDPVNFAYNY